MSTIPDALERTVAQWGAEAGTWAIGRGRNWFEVPAVRDRINFLISGRANMDLYHWLVELMARRGRQTPLECALTLGCGAGDLERGLFGIGFARRYVGVDVAAQAISRARTAAADLSGADITYEVADINTISLKANSYDAIFCPMSAHHFSDLERVFREVHRALKPGGFFLLNEYIGPKHFQWPSHQVALIDLLLRNLPERWVRTPDGGLRRGFGPPSIEDVVKVDPTEAIRSDEILPALEKEFAITAYAPYGGGLLHGLLDHIGVNFVDDSPDARAMLNTFFAIEDWALANGVLAHDFAAIVAERPEDIGGPPGIRDPNRDDHVPLDSPLGQLKEQLNSLNAQLAEMESSKRSALEQLNSLNAQLAEMESSRRSALEQLNSLNAQLAEMELWRRSALEQLEQQKEELTSLNARLAAIESSNSWRLTSPLRWLRRAIGRLAE